MTASSPDRSRASAAGTVGFFSLATAGALFTVAVWGGSPMVTKLGTGSVDGLSLAMLRTIASVPFALALIAAMRLALPWRGRDKIDLLAVALTGLIGFPVLFTLGVDHSTAGHAAVAQAATPVFAGLLVAAATRRWPSLRWWIGITVAFSGALVLIAEAIGLTAASEATWQGDLLVIGGAFCAAASFVFAARLMPRYGAPAVTMWSVVVASAILLPFLAFHLPPGAFAAFDATAWGSVLYLSAGSSIFAFITWFYALDRGGIARMSVWQFCLPLVGVALSTLVLDEPLTPLLLASAVVIVFGVALVQRR